MNNTDQNKYLGIDYGERNVGLAFGVNNLVSPLEVINGKSENFVINEINRFIIENNVSTIILGLPLTVDGKETSKSFEVRKFAKILKVYVKKPVIFQNEYGTTQEAQQELINMGTSKKRRQTKDHLSAAIMLKRYFDEHQTP